ncbi:hypothetical protein HY091_01795 [Candidatus Kaiserbacteria bacterium]|nr:hypothetical protein [Candidatus Kaiserbacteria bacterium]
MSLCAQLAFFAAITAALLLPASALAQSLVVPSGLTLTVSPQYPTPYGEVLITPLSTTFDLVNASYTLSANGNVVYRGNAKPFAVALGAAGSVTSVKAMVTGSGGSVSQSISIRPQDVALVAEPLSSVPPLYPGKALVPLEGSVRVVAVANLRSKAGKQVDPSALSYDWTLDGTELAGSSGIGKSSITVASPLQYRAGRVSVVVKSQDGALASGDLLSLTPVEPSVRVYEDDPLLGVRFERALAGSYALAGAETTLYAVPYSFPLALGAPVLHWFLNGSAAQTGDFVTLRPTGSGGGSANVSLTATAGDFARASAVLSLTFNANASATLFGL